MKSHSLLAGCLLLTSVIAAADEPQPPASAASNSIAIAKSAPFVDETLIARNIIEECGLPEEQMKVLREEAAEAGVSLVEDEAAVTAKSGKVLVVETTSAISSGNAFIGHSKQVAVRGKLFDNGAEVSHFTAMRHSMGGFGAGFKGSCTVLYRCQTAIARDILEWLKNPTAGARLGD